MLVCIHVELSGRVARNGGGEKGKIGSYGRVGF